MVVKFKSIVIDNFFSIGHAEVDLSDRGFVLVRGINNESDTPQSNGSGKSSIFDAIFFTLCGETLRGATEVVNEHGNGECKCFLSLEVNNNDYKIIRTKSGSKSNCSVYENDELLSDQLKKSQEIINKILPSLTSDILGSIVLLGQGLPYKFSSLSPIRRKELLESLSGSTGQVDKVKYGLDQEDVEYSTQLTSINKYIDIKSAEINMLTSQKMSLEEQLKVTQNPESINNEIERLTALIKDLTDKCNSLNSEIERLKSDYENKTATILVPVNNYRSQILTEINTLTETMNKISVGRCPTCGREYDNQEDAVRQVEEYQGRINQDKSISEALKSKIATVTSQLDSINTEIHQYESNYNDCRQVITRSETEIERYRQLLEMANDLSDKINKTENDIISRKVSISDNEKKKLEVQQHVDAISYLKRLLSRDFKGFLLEESIKYLSDRSSYYGDYLFSSGKKIKVSLSGNKILVLLEDRYYENLSGGERQRVDIAVQLALRDLLTTTSGFSCNLLVLDEAFDNLDAQGSESLVRLVTSELSDISSIYIVTHHSDIPVPYDLSILVIKDKDGISEVKEV